jgi:hypothetical protein
MWVSKKYYEGILRNRLLIILANSDPENPEEFNAPLFQAMLSAAMSHKVEVAFTGVLAVSGHAENIILTVQEQRTVNDLIGSVQGWRGFQSVFTYTEMWSKELIAENR